jgi:hypothetical protein
LERAVVVERLEPVAPAQDWCPWCGEDTDGDFCGAQCLREYHADVRDEGKVE